MEITNTGKMWVYWDMIENVRRGEPFALPRYSYNHFYNLKGLEYLDVIFLVPCSEQDAQYAMAPKSQKEAP